MCCISAKTTQLYQLLQNRGQSQQVTLNLMEGVRIALIAEPVGIRYIRSGLAHEAVGYQ
jgi:hypothetical protein